MADIIEVNNDYLLEVVVRNEDTGAYPDDATVTVTLTNPAGSEVGGSPAPSWPLALSYKSGTNGLYQVTLQNTLSLTAGITYTATIDISGDSLQAQVVRKLIAKVRR
jgi:hypothetical protein